MIKKNIVKQTVNPSCHIQEWVQSIHTLSKTIDFKNQKTVKAGKNKNGRNIRKKHITHIIKNGKNSKKAT